jgi:hypothetical protein
MRDLTCEEVDNVSGSFGFIGAAVGAAVGAGGQWAYGGNFNEIVAGGKLGGLSGFAGNMAGSAAAGGFVVRAAWGVRSVGLGVAASAPAPRASGTQATDPCGD